MGTVLENERAAEGVGRPAFFPDCEDGTPAGPPRMPVFITAPTQLAQQDATNVTGPGCGRTFFLCPS